ncbi:MAG: two-component regulator propeller domain-containing protein [Bacteroidia bacterium]|nr:two-component regulator propeller domain-containing protein [Bacteroidia bacterium]
MKPIAKKSCTRRLAGEFSHAAMISGRIFFVCCMVCVMPMCDRGWIGIIWGLLLLAVVPAPGQPTQSLFRFYSTAQGLSDNHVRCIYRDRQAGYLWVGTNDGLNRFDGREFVVYRRGEKGLCGNVINDLEEDALGRLWIGTQDGGVCRLDPRSGEVVTVPLLNTLGQPERYVHALTSDGDGRIWVAGDKGLFVSDSTFRRFHQADFTFANNGIYDVEYRDGVLYVGNVGRRVTCIESPLIRCTTSPTEFPYPAHTVNDIFFDSRGDCWLGTWDNQLHHWRPDCSISSYDIDGTHKLDYAGNEIEVIMEEKPGLLWLGTHRSGLWKYEVSTGKAWHAAEGLRGARVSSLLHDSSGLIWVGTDAGLHLYDRSTSQVEVIPLPATDQEVLSFVSSPDGLMLGTSRGLVTPQGTFLPDHRITDLLYDPLGQLWVGTHRALMWAKPGSMRFQFLNRFYYHSTDLSLREISSSFICGMAASQIGDRPVIWASVYGFGLVVVDVQTQTAGYALLNRKNLVENLVNQFYQDPAGRLWVCGTLRGVLSDPEPPPSWVRPGLPLQFQADSIHYMSFVSHDDTMLASKYVTDMVSAGDGTYWISTAGAGLYRFSPGQSRPFEPHPVGYNYLKRMVRDPEGRLWIIASGGLVRYDPARRQVIRLDEKDGIPPGGLTGAIFRGEDGTLYAGGRGFYIKLDPSRLSRQIPPPRTRLTHLKVMDQPADSLLAYPEIRLRHTQNLLRFSFSGMNFSHPEALTFRYKLVGLDRTWRDNGTSAEVSYNSLPPGRYTFQVEAIHPALGPGGYPATIRIRILPPFYTTWWFILLAVTAISGAVYGVIYYRIAQRRHLERIRNKIARDLHDDIGSTLGSISFYSETARIQLRDQKWDMASMVLDKIGESSREMIENMRDIIWTLHPDHDSMDKLLMRMQTFASDLLQPQGTQVIFEADPALTQVQLSMEARRNLYLIFKEAVYNSAKYAACTTLSIRLSRPARGFLALTLQDNGQGFDLAAPHTGNGLRNMRLRAAEMHARLEITAEPGKGTCLKLVM